MVTNHTIDVVFDILRHAAPEWSAPVVTQMASLSRDPYLVLIACLLSLRTKDETTGPAARRLFALADTPEAMLTLTSAQIEKAIYPVGFYKTKTQTVLEISRLLVEQHDSRVPDEIDELVQFKGVGRKTANLVVTLGYRKPGICVDTHVHRISNRWGYVTTKTPEETEMALRKKLPPPHWIEINDLLVAMGQTICHPTSPKCSLCPIEKHCAKIGVTRSR
ncbi:MAG: endonuclease III [Deltaproteobacteria bacterium]|nr:endonuclease III [Deltaproteobacteria bacterium]